MTVVWDLDKKIMESAINKQEKKYILEEFKWCRKGLFNAKENDDLTD